LNVELFTAFVLITTVLIITPGPIVTLVVATSATHGIRAGLVTVAGTVLGNAVLIGAIAFGLSFVLASSAVVFEIIRWAGAAYLIWLGVQLWRGAGRSGAIAVPRHGVYLGRGFLVGLSNPKTAAFFTAFLPQFLDPTLPAAFQLGVMCAVSIVLAALSDSAWAVAAGLGRAWFVKPQRAKLLARLSGTVLIGGGIWLSLMRRPA
jgi:threonine/homoserine/homoserine lactone efflux protein